MVTMNPSTLAELALEAVNKSPLEYIQASELPYHLRKRLDIKPRFFGNLCNELWLVRESALGIIMEEEYNWLDRNYCRKPLYWVMLKCLRINRGAYGRVIFSLFPSPDQGS